MPSERLHFRQQLSRRLSCGPCPDGGNVVVGRSVPQQSMTDKGAEYGTDFIIGSGTTKTIQNVWISSTFDGPHPCAQAGACTMYLCLANVGCADVTSPFQQGDTKASTSQFAGTKWRGGDEARFALDYQVHGSGPMIPARSTREEVLVIYYTDG